MRATRVVVRDRLREIQDSIPRHGPIHDSVAPDAAAVQELLDRRAGQGERGLAVFACHAEGLLDTLLTWSPFETRVEAAPMPILLPLARWIDHEPALVALADTNSLRLFVSQPGRLVELPGIDDAPDDYTAKETGTPDEANFQRHVDDHRDQFARRAAKLIAQTFEAEAIERVFLAGDDVAIPHLRKALPEHVGERVRDVLRWSDGPRWTRSQPGHSRRSSPRRWRMRETPPIG